jgi:predicted DNA-binding transcriptional regulator AlpA
MEKAGKKEETMEEYITVKELSIRIKLAEQSIYNMISKGDFLLNVHYLKPTPKKVLFIWSAIELWLRGEVPAANDRYDSAISTKDDPCQPKSAINA